MKLQNELKAVNAAMEQLSNGMDLQKYVEATKKDGGYKDLKTRVVWDIFYILCYSNLNLLPKGYTKFLYETYGANDNHIDTLLKKAIDTFNLNF